MAEQEIQRIIRYRKETVLYWIFKDTFLFFPPLSLSLLVEHCKVDQIFFSTNCREMRFIITYLWESFVMHNEILAFSFIFLCMSNKHRSKLYY